MLVHRAVVILAFRAVSTTGRRLSCARIAASRDLREVATHISQVCWLRLRKPLWYLLTVPLSACSLPLYVHCDIGAFSASSSPLTTVGMSRASRSGATTPLAVSDFLFREDLYSLGYVFLELVFASFCDSDAKTPDQNALKRLLEDIFKGDFRAFKEYCLTEPAWELAVAVLDEKRGNGWGLASALLSARDSGAGAKAPARAASGRRGGAGGEDIGAGEPSLISTRAILSLPYFVEND